MPKPYKIKVGDGVWLRGGKGKDPFVTASVTNVQQDGCARPRLRAILSTPRPSFLAPISLTTHIPAVLCCAVQSACHYQACLGWRGGNT